MTEYFSRLLAPHGNSSLLSRRTAWDGDIHLQSPYYSWCVDGCGTSCRRLCNHRTARHRRRWCLHEKVPPATAFPAPPPGIPQTTLLAPVCGSRRQPETEIRLELATCKKSGAALIQAANQGQLLLITALTILRMAGALVQNPPDIDAWMIIMRSYHFLYIILVLPLKIRIPHQQQILLHGRQWQDVAKLRMILMPTKTFYP